MTARADMIRWVVTWIGVGAVALGVVLLAAPPSTFTSPAETHLHQLTTTEWGTVWAAIGAAVAFCANGAWPAVLWPLSALLIVMMFWAVCFAWAGVTDHTGRGLIGGVVWVWFAGTVWCASIRASRTITLERP